MKNLNNSKQIVNKIFDTKQPVCQKKLPEGVWNNVAISYINKYLKQDFISSNGKRGTNKNINSQSSTSELNISDPHELIFDACFAATKTMVDSNNFGCKKATHQNIFTNVKKCTSMPNNMSSVNGILNSFKCNLKSSGYM